MRIPSWAIFINIRSLQWTDVAWVRRLHLLLSLFSTQLPPQITPSALYLMLLVIIGPTEDTPPGNAFQLCLPSTKSSSVERFEDTVTDSNCLPIPPKVGPNSGSLSLRETHVLEANMKPENSKNNYEDTMVCAVALELAMNCNTKNLSIMELDLRLRCGYRSARFQWEGCRVDNQVLFEVLAGIM